MTRAIVLCLALVSSAAQAPAVRAPVPSAPTIDVPILSNDPATRTRDVERFRAYHEGLVEVMRGLPPRASVSVVLRSMMRLAATRARTGSPVIENRAMLLTLGAYGYGMPLAMLVPEAADWPGPAPRAVLLTGREDFAKHFLVSAAIAAAAGGPLAVWAGIYKEIQDTKPGGSGFSFTDLAADRAGTQFGLMATASVTSARRLQARLEGAVVEADLMPSTADLPEGLSTDEVNRRYGGPNSAAYTALIAEIDRRVLALPMFAE